MTRPDHAAREADTVTVRVADERSRAASYRNHPPAREAAPGPYPRRVFGVRAGQMVAAQTAVVLVVAAGGHGPAVLVAACLAAVVLLLTAWVRLRRRWLFEWAAVGLHYLTRRRGFAVTAGLLRVVAPDAEVMPADLSGGPASVISDASGLTAVLELGDHAELLADATQPLPSPASLLPPADADRPPVRIQLVLCGAPAPGAGGGTAVTSYRQLTDGRVLGRERALLAVRVLRAQGWSDDDLRPALSSLVRKVVRRLGAVPARPLGEAALSRVLAEIAHHDGYQPVRETWRALHLGGPLQCTFRLRRWPGVRTEPGRRLVPRMLALPATATTVSLSAERSSAAPGAVAVDLTVRLAAVDSTQLSRAARALHRLLTAEGAQARRLDGEQLTGLAATLPLAACGGGLPAPSGEPLRTPVGLEVLDLPVGRAGLMIGANRHGAPVIARLFRPEATRAVLIGGVRAAQLVTLRAMALGARVVVQTTRPRVWEPFVRGLSTPGEAITLIQPGRTVDAPADALRPLLVVIDIGPVAADGQPGLGWQATLVVRDEFTPVDTDAVSRADLVVLQPLRADEAALAGSALGLRESAEWLTRIHDDMVGVVNRRAVRWALLSPTSIETQLIGTPTRPRKEHSLE